MPVSASPHSDRDPLIVDARRTAIGRAHAERGLFRGVRADDLLAPLMRRAVREVLPPELIEDVMIGCVGQHLEQGKNIARLTALLAGLPATVPGATVNRLCGSSLAALDFLAAGIQAGRLGAGLAGGVEHMHHVPMTAALDYSQALLGRYEFPFTNMGLTAERVGARHAVSRGDQDAFALRSHRLALAAAAAGHAAREIVVIDTPEGPATTDQCPRADSSLEALAGLKAVFKEGGTVTAGNSSPVSDGASLTVVASRAVCRAHGLKSRARIVDCVTVGLDPLEMGLGPVPAVRQLLKRQGRAVNDIDLWEVNEAFAAQAVAVQRLLEIREERLNPHGGAIALGHPLGATGTRLVATLLNAMESRDAGSGIVTLCIGHGQGMAMLLERC